MHLHIITLHCKRTATLPPWKLHVLLENYGKINKMNSDGDWTKRPAESSDAEGNGTREYS